MYLLFLPVEFTLSILYKVLSPVEERPFFKDRGVDTVLLPSPPVSIVSKSRNLSWSSALFEKF